MPPKYAEAEVGSRPRALIAGAAACGDPCSCGLAHKPWKYLSKVGEQCDDTRRGRGIDIEKFVSGGLFNEPSLTQRPCTSTAPAEISKALCQQMHRFKVAACHLLRVSVASLASQTENWPQRFTLR